MIRGVTRNRCFYLFASLLGVCTLEAAVESPKGNWQDVEEKAQNTIVQIFVQKAEFNWLDPYKSPEQKQTSGSGFFISDQGHILTNYHVVRLATSLQVAVQCLGRKPLDVTIVGVCPDLDVALLKLTDESLSLLRSQLKRIPCLELGSSDELYPTQEVLALGFPLGFRYLKSTVGVIAGREFLDGMCYMHITAPINPGNSGGPLLNGQGKVVGINTAGITLIPNGNQLVAAQNVGYIVPINDIKSVLKNMYTQPLVRRPELGIICNHATDEHSKYLGNPVPGGIYVNRVVKTSLADKIGICEGDMIYELECGKTKYTIDEYGDVIVAWRGSSKISLAELLMRCAIGEPLKVVVYRDGKRMELQGNFEVLPAPPIREVYPEYERDEIDYEMIGGAVIMQLRENHFHLLQSTPLLKQYLLLENRNEHVLIITRILPGSPVDMVECFYPGALLDKVNGQKVNTLTELREALMKSVQTNNIALSIKGNQSSVLSLTKVLQDEYRLAYAYRYPLTELVQQLAKAVKK